MSLAIPGVAFIVFTVLLFLGRIGEASYCFLVASTALLGLVLHGFSRLQELDLKNLRLVLREIQQTRRDLLVREEQLKAITLPLAQIVAFAGASEGRLGSVESWAIKRDWYRHKIEQLVNAVGVSPAEQAEIQKFMDKYAEIDGAFAGRGALNIHDPDYEAVKARLKTLSDELDAMMQADIRR